MGIKELMNSHDRAQTMATGVDLTDRNLEKAAVGIAKAFRIARDDCGISKQLWPRFNERRNPSVQFDTNIRQLSFAEVAETKGNLKV